MEGIARGLAGLNVKEECAVCPMIKTERDELRTEVLSLKAKLASKPTGSSASSPSSNTTTFSNDLLASFVAAMYFGRQDASSVKTSKKIMWWLNRSMVAKDIGTVYVPNSDFTDIAMEHVGFRGDLSAWIAASSPSSGGGSVPSPLRGGGSSQPAPPPPPPPQMSSAYADCITEHDGWNSAFFPRKVELAIHCPVHLRLRKTQYVMSFGKGGATPHNGFMNLHHPCTKGWIVVCTIFYKVALAWKTPEGPDAAISTGLLGEVNTWIGDMKIPFPTLGPATEYTPAPTLTVRIVYDILCSLFDDFLRQLPQVHSTFRMVDAINTLMEKGKGAPKDVRGLNGFDVFFIPAQVAVLGGDISGKLGPDRTGLHIGKVSDEVNFPIADVI